MVSSIAVAIHTPISLRDYYVAVFLREVGMRTQGIDVNSLVTGIKPVEYCKIVEEETGGYRPREYISKGNQPITVFKAFDEFSEAVLSNIGD